MTCADQRFGKRSRLQVLDVRPRGCKCRLTQSDASGFADVHRSRDRGPGRPVPSASATARAWLTAQLDDLPFVAAHYLIERHREVLLWSLLVATHDIDRSGDFSWDERATLLDWLMTRAEGRVSGDAIWIPRPARDVDREDAIDALAWSGYAPPIATRYDFISSHGYPFVDAPFVDHARPQDTGCWLHLVDCFGPTFLQEEAVVTVGEVMRRVVAVKPHCGSCLVLAGLRASSATGLDGFLPSHWNARDRAAVSSPAEPRLAMRARTIDETDYGWTTITPQLEHFDGLRDFCVRLIQRYSFVLGSSLAIRITLRGPTVDLRRTLEAMRCDAPAFVTFDDAVSNARSAKGLDALLATMGDRAWPEQAPWEA